MSKTYLQDMKRKNDWPACFQKGKQYILDENVLDTEDSLIF
jgi:hypothetical protein